MAVLLVGNRELEKELRAQIERMELQIKVILSGRISHDEIPGIYPLIDILLYPRVSVRLTELGTPLNPLETMALGKPFVPCDVGGHRELLQDGSIALLFESGDAFALAERLQLLLDDNGWRTSLQPRQTIGFVKITRGNRRPLSAPRFTQRSSK
jgi:glycosyltransferase involved in cell wall biosynthesis